MTIERNTNEDEQQFQKEFQTRNHNANKFLIRLMYFGQTGGETHSAYRAKTNNG